MRELVIHTGARVQQPGQGEGANWLRSVTGRVCQTLDLVSLTAAFLGVLLMADLRLNRYSFHPLAQVRFSWRILLLVMLCAGTWRAILMSTGIYSKQRKGLVDYWIRLLIGVNSCAFAVGLVMVVVPSRLNAWKVLEAFWLASFVMMSSFRGVAAWAHRLRRLRGVS